MDVNNPLAPKKRLNGVISRGQSIAIFNVTYMINQQISFYLSKHNISLNFQLKSDPLEFIIELNKRFYLINYSTKAYK